jgi:hypothetical protein
MLGHGQTSWRRLLAAACRRHMAKGGWHLTFPQGFLQARTVGPPDLEAKVSVRQENPNHGKGRSDEGKAPVARARSEGPKSTVKVLIVHLEFLQGIWDLRRWGWRPKVKLMAGARWREWWFPPPGEPWRRPLRQCLACSGGGKAEVQTAGRRPRHRGSTMLS